MLEKSSAKFGKNQVTHDFTIEQGDEYLIGQLVEHTNVISQGKTKEELITNLQDAYLLLEKTDGLAA